LAASGCLHRGSPMTDATALQSRLLDLRADTLRQLAEADAIVPGYLHLIAGINAALVALDATAPSQRYRARRSGRASR
jgi:hypothetical protein